MSLLLGLARGLNALYFVGTCLYCLLAYSPFANEQFIRPQLVSWLPGLVARHHELFWLTVLVTVPTLVPVLRHGRRVGRAVAAIYLAGNVGLGLWLSGDPVLSTVGADDWTLAVAFLSLLPPLALAAVDHAVAPVPAMRPLAGGRVLIAVTATAVVVWFANAALVPWHLQRAPGIELHASEWGFALAAALASQLLVGTLVCLTATAALSVVRGRPLWEYGALAVTSTIGVTLVLQRVVGATLSFGPAESGILAGLGVMLVAMWSGVAWQSAGRDGQRRPQAPEDDALDRWFAPVTCRVRAGAMVGIALLPGLAWIARSAVTHTDWNAILLRLGACVIWILALAWTTELTHRFGPSRVSRRACGVALSVMVVMGVAGVPAVARLTAWSGGPQSNMSIALDRYGSVDASYQLVRDLLDSNRGEHAAFYSFLKAHSTLGRAPVAPVEVSFASSFGGVTRPPHVFLFIVDSLRPDYLAPYNPRVAFTPATQSFAAESVVFERAFTRYGSTGLSVPAMWIGGLTLHKQYVKPFAPMNTLEKLLDGAGYRRFMSDDHLVTQLFRPSPATTLLDEGIDEMDHTMCATTEQLARQLDATRGDPRPVFAMTRPLQLHTARLVRDAPVSPAAYPGFVPGYAAQVEAMDRCLGAFVSYLKRTDLYDQSVVILTADHGESLGEDGRWGHGNALHPELLRIPLIVHMPVDAARRLTVDRSQPAFTTDITPTLYALAGHPPADRGPRYGVSLFTPVDQPIRTRRRESFLMAASYGPGYAMLRHNGRTLYVADAVQGRDFAYEMGPDGEMERRTVTEAMRAVNRRLIREQIEQIASEYRFVPASQP